MILAALAHGVLGGWDEALIYGLIVVILVAMVMLLRTERRPADLESQHLIEGDESSASGKGGSD